MTLTTLRLLGAEDAAAIEAASALVTTWREALCTPGGAGAPSFALAAGIADQVALPCSASEVDQQWDHLVDGARATAEPTADPLDAAIALHNLSMAQEGLWPDDAGKRALVEAALTRWLARSGHSAWVPGGHGAGRERGRRAGPRWRNRHRRHRAGRRCCA